MYGMDKWFHAYEEKRTNPNSEVGDLEIDLETLYKIWSRKHELDEIRDIEIPELGWTFGGGPS